MNAAAADLKLTKIRHLRPGDRTTMGRIVAVERVDESTYHVQVAGHDFPVKRSADALVMRVVRIRP